MGTTVDVLLPAGQADEVARIKDHFLAWERACSRFDSCSELSRLNGAAGRRLAVGSLLFRALSVAQAAAGATDGLFDPTLLRSLEALGYDCDFDALVAGESSPLADGPLPRTGGWRELHLDHERREAQLSAGVGVDLGGLVKGMAVDAAVDDLASRSISPVAVNAGGDLAVAGLPPQADGWAIAVEGPDHPRVISLSGGALATSSVARRRWRQGGVDRHHLIDPRTGLPSTVPLFSASVTAPSCTQAEVAAKVAFLLGPDDGSTFLTERGLSGLFLAPDGSERLAGGWATA
jgi:thiamine biosynthesis lipoprotein